MNREESRSAFRRPVQHSKERDEKLVMTCCSSYWVGDIDIVAVPLERQSSRACIVGIAEFRVLLEELSVADIIERAARVSPTCLPQVAAACQPVFMCKDHLSQELRIVSKLAFERFLPVSVVCIRR